MRSLIALLFLFPFFLIGQESSDSLEEDEYEYIEYISFEKYGIGITPSALVNIYGGIQISQDFGLSENLNISLETAYLYNLSFNKPASGFRIKPGIQYMFWSEGITGLAIGINANYRNTTTTRLFRRIYWQENFEETRRVKRNRELIGGDAMFSFFFRLSDALLYISIFLTIWFSGRILNIITNFSISFLLHDFYKLLNRTFHPLKYYFIDLKCELLLHAYP